jgi:hypothetical protein
MDDKALKKTLSDILSKVSSNSNINNDLQKDVKLLVELVNTIDQRVADISMKVDQFLNAGAKKPKAIPKAAPKAAPKAVSKTTSTKPDAKKAPAKKAPAKKKAVSTKAESDDETDGPNDAESDVDAGASTEPTPIGQIKNILSYFKTRYGEDPECFADHLEENQAAALFAEHEDTIASKKDGDVRSKYKATLLYKCLTKTQKDKIRELMLCEKEHADADNSNDLEPDNGNDSD